MTTRILQLSSCEGTKPPIPVFRLSGHQGVLVQGPPGTRKSHTIVNLICHLLASGKRVLVTSHTARALKVLQRYIHDRVSEISRLAVVLLGDNRDALQSMEDSDQGITNRQNHWEAARTLQHITDLETELHNARREEAQILSELREIRERETFAHARKFDNYEGTLQAIANRLRDEAKNFSWLADHPPEEQGPPLTNELLLELLKLLRDDEVARWESSGLTAIDVGTLPEPDQVTNLIEQESQAQATFDQTVGARTSIYYEALREADPDVRVTLLSDVTAVLRDADSVGRHINSWAKRAAKEVLGDHDRVWRDLLELTREHLAAIGRSARLADETPITGLGDRDHHETRADAEAMLNHLVSGGNWGFGPFRSSIAKRAQYLQRDIKVAGRTADTPESLKTLITWLDVNTRLSLLRNRWKSLYPIPAERPLATQVTEFEDLCEPLDLALSLHKWKLGIQNLIRTISGLPEPGYHNVDELKILRDSAAAVDSAVALQSAQIGLKTIRQAIEARTSDRHIYPSANALISAVDARNVDDYRNAFHTAAANQQAERRMKRRDNLLFDLHSYALILADQIRETSLDLTWSDRATKFADAWNWARAESWVQRMCKPDTEQQLTIRLNSTRDQIRHLLRELAAEKAWSHCFARMTEHERQHLVAWSKAVRAIGKGTGKYAPMHRRNAREHMNECRSAIPAWVMPIYRVAETIRPGKDLFDVVIVDEASQSGPEALLLAYLAKTLVVVGDDKQISPTYAGIHIEDVNHLRARHLTNVPHADAYGVHQSFFDLAEIRYQSRIRLREHFRCMPEIIQFSNSLCYASEPLIPLRQYGQSRLSPVVSARHVPEGYMKGTGQSVSNPPEAEAVVDEILRMHSDERYEGKTFGVIGLLGQAQAREVETLLLKRMGPREMETRQLVCGDAYAFQGDERDVMFLSLVSAPSESRRIGTLVDEAAKRRFNVAASRARDQMVLFHSATLNDLSPQCLRYALLQYCLNPSAKRDELSGRPITELEYLAATADRDTAAPPAPFDSWFELDVFLRITARGYRVLPQYEVAGYGIDLVVDGMERRVAVECDGDHWHGPDRYDEDMARQRLLERCGWTFWRVRGSAFSLDPDKALEPLWSTLERSGVFPHGKGPVHQTHENPVVAAESPTSTESVTNAEFNENDILNEKSGKHHDTRNNLANVIPLHRTLNTSRSESPEHEESRVQETFQSTRDSGQSSRSLSARSQTTEEVRPTAPAEGNNTEELKSGKPGRDASLSETASTITGAPFIGWEPLARPPDPTEANPEDLVPAILEILATEGPMSVDRLCRVFVKGAGRHRVVKQSRRTLNRAISRTIRQGQVATRDETQAKGMKEWILRISGKPFAVVRSRGDREFVEIPPSEIATIIRRLEANGIQSTNEEIFRAVLDFYDTKRLTSNISQRLEWIFENREALAPTNQSTSSGLAQ